MIRNLSLLALALLPASSLQAALVAYEPFDYTAISNGTAANGDGFSGNWTIQGNNTAVTVSTGLTLPSFQSEGNSGTSQYATRAVTTLASPVVSGIVNATLLFKANGNSGGDGVGFLLTGSSASLFVGFAGGFSATETTFGLGAADTGNGWANPTSFAAAGNFANTALHYVALQINLANNEISLWMNPTVAAINAGTPGPATLTISSVALGSVTGIGINAIGGALPTIDEVRIGTTWASVSGAVPEPGVAGLLGLTGLVLLVRRRLR